MSARRWRARSHHRGESRMYDRSGNRENFGLRSARRASLFLATAALLGTAGAARAQSTGTSYGPGISSDGSGRLDVFTVGTDKTVWHRRFNNGWTNWESLGGQGASEVDAVSWGVGRIDA